MGDGSLLWVPGYIHWSVHDATLSGNRSSDAGDNYFHGSDPLWSSHHGYSGLHQEFPEFDLR